jgi:hypothetical protein
MFYLMLEKMPYIMPGVAGFGLPLVLENTLHARTHVVTAAAEKWCDNKASLPREELSASFIPSTVDVETQRFDRLPKGSDV